MEVRITILRAEEESPGLFSVLQLRLMQRKVHWEMTGGVQRRFSEKAGVLLGSHIELGFVFWPSHLIACIYLGGLHNF